MENRNLAIVLEFHYSEKRYEILDAAVDQVLFREFEETFYIQLNYIFNILHVNGCNRREIGH